MVQIHLKQVNYQRASVHLHVYIYTLCIYCVYTVYIICRFPWFSWLFHDFFMTFHIFIGILGMWWLGFSPGRAARWVNTWRPCRRVRNSENTARCGSSYTIYIYILYACISISISISLYIYRDFIEGCTSSFPEKIKDLWMWYGVHSFSVRGLLSISPRSLMAHQKSCWHPQGNGYFNLQPRAYHLHLCCGKSRLPLGYP